MEYPVQRPHDTFFKQTLGEAAIAKDFLQNYLPPSLAEWMDFSTLTLQNGSFVGKHLKEYFTDLLYRVQLEGKDSYLYFLLEELPDAKQRAMRFEELMNYVFVARKEIDLEKMKQVLV